MRITGLELHNFKRFTQLTLTGIPAEAKLVLLIGSNGSGKSSVFDAFELLNKGGKENTIGDKNYYWKTPSKGFELKLSYDKDKAGGLTLTDDGNLFIDKLNGLNFYGRSSFRQLPRLTRTNLGGRVIDIKNDSDRPQYFIDRDERFENDIENITGIILRDLFRSSNPQEKIRERFIDPINKGLSNIFGENNGTKLELIEIIPPLDGKIAQVTFRKGQSEFHYNHLSAGEKEVINILINLSSRRDALENAICFFDEIDLHLNTKLQFRLMQEIVTNWIPDNSQFWTASHSLGFIEYARTTPDAVTLDFDDLDFDLPQTLRPVPKEQNDVYEIAVGKEFLPSLLEGKRICFVENKDRDLYGAVGITDVLFASGNNRNNVYHKVLNDKSLWGIVDRNFLTDDDIQLIRQQYEHLYILPYYSIENLLFHPENLQEYYTSKGLAFDKEDYIKALFTEKKLVANKLIIELALTRTGYPYFGEQAFSNKQQQKRFRNNQENFDQVETLSAMLNSGDFETWYKVFPMKTYATNVPQRQNIAKSELAKMTWFKIQIQNLLE